MQRGHHLTKKENISEKLVPFVLDLALKWKASMVFCAKIETMWLKKDTLVLPFQSQLERNWIRLKSYCKPDAISNGIPIGTKNLPINCESAWDNQYQTMEKCYFNFLYISYLNILIYQLPITKFKEHPKMMKIGKYFVYIEKLAN